MDKILEWETLTNITRNLDSGIILEHLSVADLPKGIKGSHVLLPAATMVFDLAGSSVSIREHGALKFVERYQNMFRIITDIIYDEGGIVEKFPGDGITMHFVQEDRSKASAQLCREQAVKAAMKIINHMSHKESVHFSFRLSLAYGEDTIATKIGSQRHSEWISIGHAVNVAHKLEKVIKEAHCIMGMDENCYKAFRSMYPSTSVYPHNMPPDLRQIETISENWYGLK